MFPSEYESLVTHATGLAALGLNIGALLHRNDRRMHSRSGYSAVLWTVNNLLLGAHTAAAMSALSAGRQAMIGAERGARARALACSFFVVVSLVAGALTWQGWHSTLATIAMVLATVAMFYCCGSRLRLAMVASAVLWMGNAYVFRSWEQAAANLLVALAAGWGAWQARDIRQPD